MHFTLVLWIFLLVSTAVAGPNEDPAPATNEQINRLRIGQVIMVDSPGHDPSYATAIFMGRTQGKQSNPDNLKLLRFEPEESSVSFKNWAVFGEYFPEATGGTIEFKEHTFKLGGKISLCIRKSRKIYIPDTTVVLNPGGVKTLRTKAIEFERLRASEHNRRKKKDNQRMNRQQVENQKPSSANPNVDAGQH